MAPTNYEKSIKRKLEGINLSGGCAETGSISYKLKLNKDVKTKVHHRFCKKLFM